MLPRFGYAIEPPYSRLRVKAKVIDHLVQTYFVRRRRRRPGLISPSTPSPCISRFFYAEIGHEPRSAWQA